MYVTRRGMTLIDVLVGTSVALVIFLGIFGILRASAVISGAAANKAAALAIANSKLEQMRSLSYTSIGTVGGIPAGTIPQETTVMSDAVRYFVRTFISYYDDPKDGLGASDSNGIVTDYKRAKVTVSYFTQNGEKEVSVVSTFAPPGIETTVGGGTLRVVAVNASGVAVPGAEVTVVNASTTPAVNLTTFTDFAGYALLPGAATSTGYRITVTKEGWSTAQTYSQTSSNQNPTPGHLTIAGGQTTTGTFAIDLLANLSVRTFSPVVPTTWSDTFTDASKVATLSSASVTGGAITLSNGGSGYALSGNAVATSTAPTYLAGWHSATFAATQPSGTTLRVKVVDASGNALPDSAIPGNSTGFTTSPINLSAVATSTYPALALRADLSTNATTTTPSLLDWSLAYSRGPVPLPSIAFTLTGAKTIGSTIAGVPVYKTTIATTTSSTGTRDLSLEWDTYALTLSGYTVLDTCDSFPYEVLPGATGTAAITLATTTGTALRLYAKNAGGDEIAGATLTVSGGGVSRTLPGNRCGFAYFGGLTNGTYTVSGTAPGVSGTFSNVNVSGYTTYDAILQ